MRNPFLCPNHRQWLFDNPNIAKNCFQDTLETGLDYRELGNLAAAARYFGCATETADILLSSAKGKDKVAAYQRLVTSTLHLVESLQQQCHLSMASNIQMYVYNKLMSELQLSRLDRLEKESVFSMLDQLPVTPKRQPNTCLC